MDEAVAAKIRRVICTKRVEPMVDVSPQRTCLVDTLCSFMDQKR